MSADHGACWIRLWTLIGVHVALDAESDPLRWERLRDLARFHTTRFETACYQPKDR